MTSAYDRTLDLFAAAANIQRDVNKITDRYPNAPGYKTNGPSKDAAESMRGRASLLRDRVVVALAERPMTADECAEALGESVLSIRPRFTELRARGAVVDTGERRQNASGRSATAWAIAREDA